MDIKIRIGEISANKNEIAPIRVNHDVLLNGKKQPANPMPAKSTEGKEKLQLESIMGELDSLIGLREVKSLIYEVQAFTEIQKLRSRNNLASEPTVLHAIFRGNPGSGKTTVARILAKLYKEMGVPIQRTFGGSGTGGPSGRIHRSYRAKNQRTGKKSFGRRTFY